MKTQTKWSVALTTYSFRLLVIIAICISFAPLLPGLGGLLLAAFGYIPAIGQHALSLTGLQQLWLWPGLGQSITLTLFIGVASTLLAALFSFSILQACWRRRGWQHIENLLAPVMALPHVAFAIGFAFLFIPSGFGARIITLLAEVLSGATPGISNWSLIKDKYGLGLVLALTLKEIPFVLFMSMAVLKQLNVEANLRVAQSLGYSRAQAWQKIIFPQWLTKIRFTLFAVMAYSLSVVDVALILGPTQPPPLAVLVWQWLNDADLSNLGKASTAGLLLLLLCITALLSLRLGEWLLTRKWRSWQISGRFALPIVGHSAITVTLLTSLAILPILTLWSLAQRWRFPDLLPSKWSLRFWQQEWAYLWEIIATSAIIALISATIALLLAIILHQHNAHSRYRVPRLLIALPMLTPQLSLLFGIQVASLYLASNYYLLVIWAHAFFALPYIFMALDGPWRSYDQRLDKVGLSLGLSPWRVWWQIKRPILMPAIWLAWAVGISVSLAQYLPTLMLGAGRISTLTTEAVALSSGQDRRVSAIYALLQSLLPFVFYLSAIIASRHCGALARRAPLFAKPLAAKDSVKR